MLRINEIKLPLDYEDEQNDLKKEVARLLKIKIQGKEELSIFKSPTPERFIEVMKVLKRDYTKVILPKDK